MADACRRSFWVEGGTLTPADIATVAGSAPKESYPKETLIMSTVTIEEAQAKLLELIDRLAPGEEVVITRNQQPVAKFLVELRLVI